MTGISHGCTVLAVVLSMLYGFTPAYCAGLVFYLCVFAISFVSSKKVNPGSVTG